jgi:DNA polymerase-3 subunit epsilon
VEGLEQSTYRLGQDVKPISEHGLIFIDTETSGLNPRRDCLISIGAVATDLRGYTIQGIFSQKVKPTGPVSAEAAAVNGYTPEGWRDATPVAQAIHELLVMAQDRIFVAHNAPFDWGFIQAAMGHLKWPGDYHKVDTAALAWPLLLSGKVADLKLATLGEYFGYSNPAEHDALADAKVCRIVYLSIMRLWRYGEQFDDPVAGAAKPL